MRAAAVSEELDLTGAAFWGPLFALLPEDRGVFCAEELLDAEPAALTAAVPEVPFPAAGLLSRRKSVESLRGERLFSVPFAIAVL